MWRIQSQNCEFPSLTQLGSDKSGTQHSNIVLFPLNRVASKNSKLKDKGQRETGFSLFTTALWALISLPHSPPLHTHTRKQTHTHVRVHTHAHTHTVINNSFLLFIPSFLCKTWNTVDILYMKSDLKLWICRMKTEAIVWYFVRHTALNQPLQKTSLESFGL